MGTSEAFESAGHAAGALLVQIGVGFVMRGVGGVDGKGIGVMNKLVFGIGIPCLVFRVLATQDLDKLDWDFIGAFLVLRAGMLVWGILSAGAGMAWVGKGGIREGVRRVVSDWVGTTWINTIIFGAPILASLYGKKDGVRFAVLASISSFLFMLPLLLVLLEVTKPVEGEGGVEGEEEEEEESGSSGLDDDDGYDGYDGYDDEEKGGTGIEIAPIVSPVTKGRSIGNAGEGEGEGKRRAWYVVVGLRLLATPPLWGIACGLGWAGIVDDGLPRWVDLTTESLGGFVTPVAALAIGAFMADSLLNAYAFPAIPFLSKLVSTPSRGNDADDNDDDDEEEEEEGERLSVGEVVRMVYYVVVKLTIVPLVALGIAHVWDFDRKEREACVLVAAMPLAVSAFVLGSQYGNDARIMAVCVSLTTVLCLLGVLGWIAVLGVETT